MDSYAWNDPRLMRRESIALVQAALVLEIEKLPIDIMKVMPPSPGQFDVRSPACSIT